MRVALIAARKSVWAEFAVAAVKLLSIVAVSVRPGQKNRSADLVAALSLATDIGNGYPLEKTLRTCLLAIRLAELNDFPIPDQADVYYLTLLRSIACTSFAHEEARDLGGDDIAANLLYGAADSASLTEMGYRSLRSLARGAGAINRARALAKVALNAKRIGDQMCFAHFDVRSRLAARLGMGPAVIAVGAPAYFPGFAIPIWGIVIGVWLFAAGRVSRPAAVTTQRTA